MEDTLRELSVHHRALVIPPVLILVLMEDTLRVALFFYFFILSFVLILVLMEDTLRDSLLYVNRVESSLNPCFNGRYSQRR